MILPVVICLCWRLSHACQSLGGLMNRDCGWLNKSVVISLVRKWIVIFIVVFRRVGNGDYKKKEWITLWIAELIHVIIEDDVLLFFDDDVSFSWISLWMLMFVDWWGWLFCHFCWLMDVDWLMMELHLSAFNFCVFWYFIERHKMDGFIFNWLIILF